MNTDERSIVEKLGKCKLNLHERRNIGKQWLMAEGVSPEQIHTEYNLKYKFGLKRNIVVDVAWIDENVTNKENMYKIAIVCVESMTVGKLSIIGEIFDEVLSFLNVKYLLHHKPRALQKAHDRIAVLEGEIKYLNGRISEHNQRMQEEKSRYADLVKTYKKILRDEVGKVIDLAVDNVERKVRWN